MKFGAVKILVIIFLLVSSLVIPTSALATYGNTYNDQNFFESIFSFIFNGTGEKNSWDKDKDDWDDDWKDWDKGKHNWGHWDGCKKGKDNRCIESYDIWKDWYGGKNKDKNDDHDYGWDDKHGWYDKKDYSWVDDNKINWFSWIW
ncbi:hypothetical protein [Metabacillus halosaccharovorans]|uniref:hypothetical protein n=1 Tax=Metabacillus halosaccharovorans TaxID=930124 RepID=UPI00099503B5|nr:hypothetical protein [Metabacillus halosaccharovorans]